MVLWKVIVAYRNICTKLHVNLSIQDISYKTTNVNLMVALKEKSQEHQSHYDESSGDHEYVYHFFKQSI